MVNGFDVGRWQAQSWLFASARGYRFALAGFAKLSVLFCLSGPPIYTVMADELHGIRSVADNQPSVNTSAISDLPAAAPSPSLSRSFSRPPSLPEPNPNGDTLRAYASKLGLYFGSMIEPLDGNGWETPWVRNMLGSEFNMLMPGNQLKWGVIHPAQDSFNFEPGDAFIDFAVAHNMKVHGHILLWGAWNPEWLGNEAARNYTKFSGEELEAILVNHIRTVMGHYRDKYPGVVKWWNVTNELMGWNNQFNSDGILWTKIGTNPDRADYLRVAFRTARAADPDAILCMKGEWASEGSILDRTQNMIDAVRAFKAEGIPIDCVGMQAHLTFATAPTYEQVLKTMNAYAEMGVQVQITEFDIQAPRSARDWNKASQIATDMLRACVDSPNCTVFNLWGFSQAYLLNSAGNPETVTMLPWDEKNKKSPLYSAMRSILKVGAQRNAKCSQDHGEHAGCVEESTVLIRISCRLKSSLSRLYPLRDEKDVVRRQLHKVCSRRFGRGCA